MLHRAARVAQGAALLAGLIVLLVSVGTSVVTARDQRVAAQDSQLTTGLGHEVDALTGYFDRARTIDLLLAANPAFTDFYRAPGSTAAKIKAGGRLLRRVNDALAYLETLFPGRIGEACFIDSSGAEIARTVDGAAAPAAKLSRNEKTNAFFAPTLALAPGQVYQAREYVSDDTHNEVISNSTLVSAAGHTGLVHFEISLDSFRTPATAQGVTASIIDAGTGRVIVDSRSVTSVRGAADQSLARLTKRAHSGTVVTLGNRRVAFQRLSVGVGNANDWYVAVSAAAAGTGWTRGLSVGSLALLCAALLTILVSMAGWWMRQRASRRAAAYDSLTGLPTGALLIQRLREALRTGRPTAVLALDLERFKQVNDLLGHGHGDLLLRQVADRLTGAVPPTATVARLGGDDFVVLLPDTEPAAAEHVAGRILAALHRSFHLDGTGIDLEARIGMAAGPTHGTEAATLVRHADTAMHVAKEQHEGLRVYDPAADRRAVDRLALLGDLRRALDVEDQILLHYQPKVALADGRLTGVEALVRWSHPQRGRIAPDSFIPLAETTTLIHALTTRVLDIAVRQAASWQRAGTPVVIAVNLSARSLSDSALPGRVFALLDRYGVPPALLKLEITESAVMTDPDRALEVLHALHDGGIGLSVDDFGTGHSSMAYLQRLPVDELKIDRSFIQQLSARSGNDVLVRTAITLGHNLGLSVVAEGVEDEQTLAALRDLGCDVAQGYHLGRPAPADELAPWLHRQATAA